MTEPTCMCDHSRGYHFMNFGKCRWRQTTPHGDIACDCHIYEADGDTA